MVILLNISSKYPHTCVSSMFLFEAGLLEREEHPKQKNVSSQVFFNVVLNIVCFENDLENGQNCYVSIALMMCFHLNLDFLKL